MEMRSPEQNLEVFTRNFAGVAAKLDKKVDEHLVKLSSHTTLYIQLPYYAVIFEQPIAIDQIRPGRVHQPISPDHPAMGRPDDDLKRCPAKLANRGPTRPVPRPMPLQANGCGVETDFGTVQSINVE